jgi:cyanate lyase
MKEKIYQAGLLLKSALERGKVDLSNDEKAAIELICRKPGQGTPGGSFGKPLIYRFFGDKPVVGATIKALKIFEDTGKGFHEINQQIKKWAEKGNIVTYDVTTKVYKLDKIGVLPDYVK